MAPPAVSPAAGVLAALEALDSREARFPGTTTALARQLTARRDDGLNHLLSRRSTIRPRGLDKGGIAGVVVGCIVGVFLVCLCFYPFIVRRIKKRKALAAAERPDAEVAHAPAAAGALSTAPEASEHQHEAEARQSSNESFPHKDDSLNGTNQASSHEGPRVDAATTAAEAVDHEPEHQERGAPVAHENIIPRNHSLSRHRNSDVSLGTHPRWNTEGPPPLSPGGIELVTTRADGLEYSEAMAGQSASYYSPTVPSEAFGMATPPPADDGQFSPPPRSNSRTSSLKYSLMSMMRRMSSKDTGKGSPAGEKERAGPWMPPVDGAADRQQLSESPVIQDGPSFRDFGGLPAATVPRLGTPMRFPMSPASTVDTGSHDEQSPEPPADRAQATRQSPQVLPPSSPPPGTVNPMDIMKPSNQSEHVWHTDRELFYLANPHVSPPRKSISPNDEAAPTASVTDLTQAPTPASNEIPAPVKMEPRDDATQPGLLATPARQQDADVDMTTEGAPAVQYDHSHLTPAFHMNGQGQGHGHGHGHGRNASIATSEGNWTDRSDRSTPLPSHMSSIPSHHNTPNTQLTDISPSPRSDMGFDIRNSASPLGGNGASPQIYTCGECGRSFDQIHKLNHHRRYHERPHECPHANCDKRFGTKTHLDRHINDKHKKTRKYHCLEQACPYSRAGGKGFPRKDNWRRHMINKHGMNPAADPEPDVADDAMEGM